MDGNAFTTTFGKGAHPEQIDEQSRLTTLLNAAKSTLQDNLSRSYTEPKPDSPQLNFERADSIWFDDALPPGAKAQGDGPNPWTFVGSQSIPCTAAKINGKDRRGSQLTFSPMPQNLSSSVKTTPSSLMSFWTQRIPGNRSTSVQ